ncbi:hypothetical protein ACP6PM_23370, partial [Dapis sp. BLCC M229]
WYFPSSNPECDRSHLNPYGKLIKKSGYQNYICRLTELRRKDKRHSNFWVGMYGELWVMAWEYLVELVTDLMNFNPQKKSKYQRGLKALSILNNS